MKQDDWIEISINTTIIVGELLSTFFENEGSKGFILGEWNDEPTSEYTTVKAYFPSDYKDIEGLTQRIKETLKYYSELKINIGSGDIKINNVNEEDWEKGWKEFFKTFRIGKNIIIKPSWEDYQKNENEIIINIDPKMSFGSGTHETTQLCLEEIEILAEQIKDKNIKILDLGTGTGILAIALGLFGFKNITAVDIESKAVETTNLNLKINNLESINTFQGEIKDCKEKYNLIVGNLLAEIIEELSSEINDKLEKDGLFIGSGIIKRKEQDVINSLEKQNLTLTDKKYKNDWVVLNFKK